MPGPVRSLVEQLAALTENDAADRARERGAQADNKPDARLLASQFRRMSPAEAKEWLHDNRWHEFVDPAIEKIQKFAGSDLLGPIEDAIARPGKLDQFFHADAIATRTVREPSLIGTPNWRFHATVRQPEQHRVEVSRGEPGAAQRAAKGDAIYLHGPNGQIDFRLGVDHAKVDRYFEGIAKAAADKLNGAGKWALAREWKVSPTYGQKCYSFHGTGMNFAFRWEHPVDGNTLMALLSMS